MTAKLAAFSEMGKKISQRHRVHRVRNLSLLRALCASV